MGCQNRASKRLAVFGAKLTEHQSRDAISHRDGETVRDIARHYNFSDSTISRL